MSFRFKILFNFLESGFHNKNSSIYMSDLFTSIMNSLNFYKLHKNKSPECIIFNNS